MDVSSCSGFRKREAHLGIQYSKGIVATPHGLASLLHYSYVLLLGMYSCFVLAALLA